MKMNRPRRQRYFGLWMTVAGSMLVQWMWSVPTTLAESQSPIETPAPTDNFIVSIRREGGMCFPPGCFSEVAIFSDGTYRYTTHQSNPIRGRIRNFELKTLRKRIAKTDFEEIRSPENIKNPLPNLCLLPVDGPEAVYTFPTGMDANSPSENDIEQIRGCQTSIDANNPLFRQLEQLYSQISEQATTEPESSQDSLEFFSQNDRSVLGTLPMELANAVMQDARKRFTTGALLPNSPENIEVELGVDSIKPVTWNWCRGGGERPSPPYMGICPDVTVSGWQMVVRGDLQANPFSLVYYIPENTDPETFVPSPDGLQSLPPSVRTKVLEAAAKQTGVSTSEIQIHWVDAQFFDGCLNSTDTEMSCGDAIHSGWQVEVLGNSFTSQTGWGMPLWIYHANWTGTDVRLIQQSRWSPPPSAPPAKF
jgi:hypothetical protein